jgi:Phage integrase, N-terminal SAM-like domain
VQKPRQIGGGPAPESVAVREAVERAGGFARAEKAESTRRAYRSDSTIFEGWCAAHSASALPATPEMVAAFIAAEAERGAKASTIGQRFAAIRLGLGQPLAAALSRNFRLPLLPCQQFLNRGISAPL